MVHLRDVRYLTGVAVVLNIATSGPAFVVVEVPVAEGDSGEVLPAGAEPASARGVGSLPTAGSTHVVDDGVHIDVDLLGIYSIVVATHKINTRPLSLHTFTPFLSIF